MKEKSYSLTFDCVWIAANLLLCSVAFSPSPTHADVTYGAGQEVVGMYLAKSPAPTPPNITLTLKTFSSAGAR